jgi:hypothetical protein
MASTLNRTGESRPDVLKGHSTRDLGPSDSTDTGSDVAGGPGLGDLEPLDLERGATTDPDRSGDTAGPDVGDSDLDSDSDAGGTGENITAGRDPVHLNRDVLPDRIIDDLSELDEDDPPGPAANVGSDSSGMTTDRAGGSTASPSDEVPSLDNPPPVPPGGDLPVADRDEGALPHSSIDRTRQIYRTRQI